MQKLLSMRFREISASLTTAVALTAALSTSGCAENEFTTRAVTDSPGQWNNALKNEFLVPKFPDCILTVKDKLRTGYEFLGGRERTVLFAAMCVNRIKESTGSSAAEVLQYQLDTLQNRQEPHSHASICGNSRGSFASVEVTAASPERAIRSLIRSGALTDPYKPK